MTKEKVSDDLDLKYEAARKKINKELEGSTELIKSVSSLLVKVKLLNKNL